VFDQIIFSADDNDEYTNLAIYNISAGHDHVLAIDEKHIIWGWGKNLLKQVSPKFKDPFINVPVKIPFVIII